MKAEYLPFCSRCNNRMMLTIRKPAHFNAEQKVCYTCGKSDKLTKRLFKPELVVRAEAVLVEN
jgi:hypothetical protein